MGQFSAMTSQQAALLFLNYCDGKRFMRLVGGHAAENADVFTITTNPHNPHGPPDFHAPSSFTSKRASNDSNWKQTLKQHGLGKARIIQAMDEAGWDEPGDWGGITEEDLEEMKFKNSDRLKWQRMMAALQPKAKEKEFVYRRDYDGNGVVYWVGTKYGTTKWKNPSKRGLIKVDSSEWLKGSVDAMVAKEACHSYSDFSVGAWASIEFVDGVTVKPTKYTLSHCTYFFGGYLRSWAFEGSEDGAQWTVIREHSNDGSLSGAGQSHSWDTPNADGYFSRFRVRMTGKSLSGEWRLSAHALEIYGFVRGGK